MPLGMHHRVLEHALEAHVLAPAGLVDGAESSLIDVCQGEPPAGQQVLQKSVGFLLDIRGFRGRVNARSGRLSFSHSQVR